VQQAIVFDGIHFLHIFFYLMAKRYDLLARHFVLLDGAPRDEVSVIALLRERTRRIALPPLVPQVA
jgi:hypothetical protein